MLHQPPEFGVGRRSEHDHSIAEAELGMGDRAVLVWHNKLLFEAEHAAEPIDRGRGVTVTKTGDHCRSCVFRNFGHGFLLNHFGGIRKAPSRRITSPLSIAFSMMCLASAAYSAGTPSRAGNGTCAPSAFLMSSDRPASSGVSNKPGAMVTTRIPDRARSRAIGNVIPTIPPFDAEYAACPICPSKAAIEAVLMITPRSPPAFGSCPARSEEHTSELQSRENLVCRLLLEKKKKKECDSGPSAKKTKPK